MASLDNALDNRQMPHWFARDPIARTAKLYLASETMSLG
jgi:hypothetical protein